MHSKAPFIMWAERNGTQGYYYTCIYNIILYAQQSSIYNVGGTERNAGLFHGTDKCDHGKIILILE